MSNSQEIPVSTGATDIEADAGADAGSRIKNVVPIGATLDDTDGRTSQIQIPPDSRNQVPKKPLIRYKVEYMNGNQTVYITETEKPANEIHDSYEGSVFELFHVRFTWLSSDAPELRSNPFRINPTIQGSENRKKDESLPPYAAEGHPYMYISSPAVIEALRSVNSYYPQYDFNTKRLLVDWPYSIFWHLEEELTEYQQKFRDVESHPHHSSCRSRHAFEHLTVMWNFIRGCLGEAVDRERERHSRGMATFEMLWLILKPGVDVYLDRVQMGQWETYVIKSIGIGSVGGSIVSYNITVWNLRANSRMIGPSEFLLTVHAFAGEKEIRKLRIYPCEFDKTDEQGQTAQERRQRFIDNGKKYLKLRRKGCWDFDGYSTYFPQTRVRNPFSSRSDKTGSCPGNRSYCLIDLSILQVAMAN
jgi:hypothetical protein